MISTVLDLQQRNKVRAAVDWFTPTSKFSLKLDSVSNKLSLHMNKFVLIDLEISIEY